MASSVSDYLSALKKRHHDDLPDYDKGKIHGVVEGQVVYIGVSMACILLGVYKRNR